MTDLQKLPDEPTLSSYTTRYGLSIPQGNLSQKDWQTLMGILREGEERVQFYKADMLMYAAQNFLVDKRDGKTIRQRLLWQDVYTPEEITHSTAEEKEELHQRYRRIQASEIATLANLKPSTVHNYLKVVRIWTLERRAEFDLSVMNFADFEAVASQSIQDVPYEQQRGILKKIEAQRIQILTEQDPTTTETTIPKTNAVLLQARAAKVAKKVTGDSSFTFYPDKRFQRPFASREELSAILGNDIEKLPDGPDVVGYTVEIKVWAISKEEQGDD